MRRLTDSPDRWLTIDQLSDRQQVPVKTLRDWRLRGFGPRGVKLGGHVRYRLADVETWERQQEAADTAGTGAA